MHNLIKNMYLFDKNTSAEWGIAFVGGQGGGGARRMKFINM